MTKTFCDRCGKEITKRGVYAWLTHRCYYATLRMISSGSDDTTHESDDKYICPECEDSYIHWFMNPEKKESEAGIDVDPWAKEMAEELLKEQEPVKPTVNVDTWICSKCGHTLESQELIDDNENPQVLIHEQYNYCPNCGKAVKWDADK